MLSEQTMKDFMIAMDFIRNHKMMKQYEEGIGYSDFFLGLFDCLCIEVVLVDPLTLEINDIHENNTKVQVWLEFGFPECDDFGRGKREWLSAHDISLDVGADTFEEAIILLAKRIKEKYK